MKQSVGFIGGGRVTRILLQAFCNKDVKFSSVVVTDPNFEVTSKLKHVYPFINVSDASLAASQDIVFISLHPPVILDTLESLKKDLRENATVISLAPKINISKIASKIGHVKKHCQIDP